MSMANEVMKLIFAVLDVSFNIGHNTVIIKGQFLYINFGLWSVRLCVQDCSLYIHDYDFRHPA